MIIGYALTAVILFSFFSLIALIFINRKTLYGILSERLNLYSIAMLVLIIAFFVIFSLLFVHPVEQLYFDENIYQGIALNILHNGNSLWCQYGTDDLRSCFVNAIYHDPVSWSAFMAIAFALFGAGIATAYALQLLVGVLSILGVFLLSSMLSERKEVPLASALIFALIPELLIWTRTQAVLDMPFMMLTIFAFFFFAIFVKKMNKWTFAMFGFSMMLAVYMRIEGIMLIPLFAILYLLFGNEGAWKTVRERIGTAIRNIDGNISVILILLVLMLVLLPQIYYISTQAAAPGYGQPTGKLFAISNFINTSAITNITAQRNLNAYVNTAYFLGAFNKLQYYPTAFPLAITLIAFVGIAVLLFDTENKNRRNGLLSLGLWFIAYFLFYGLFYAGGATFGVDSRFMLELLPPVAIFGGIGLVEISYLIAGTARKRLNEKRFAQALCVLLMIILLYFSFIKFIPIVTVPTQDMPMQGLPLGATNFIYSNYNVVPTNCLVFTFTPDIWYELNRSAAQISYLTGANQTIKSSYSQFSCFVFDSGYWCTVPPYQNGLCATIKSTYDLKPLALGNSSNGAGFGLYQILNYT